MVGMECIHSHKLKRKILLDIVFADRWGFPQHLMSEP